MKFVSEQIFSQHLITWKCKNFHIELVCGVFYPTFAIWWNQMTNSIIKNSMSITYMRSMFLNSKRALILSSIMILLPLPNLKLQFKTTTAAPTLFCQPFWNFESMVYGMLGEIFDKVVQSKNSASSSILMQH